MKQTIWQWWHRRKGHTLTLPRMYTNPKILGKVYVKCSCDKELYT